MLKLLFPTLFCDRGAFSQLVGKIASTNTNDARRRKLVSSDREISQKHSENNIDLLSEISLKPLPFLALLAILLPGIFLIWMHFSPSVLAILQRDSNGLSSRQWWRFISPLLVDSDGWIQFLFVSIGFIFVGIPAQHYLGVWRWLLLFFAGAIVGEFMGYLWQPYGGGTSIALFGMVIFMLRRKQPTLFLTSIYSICVVTALVCFDIGNTWLLIGLYVMLAVLIRIVLSRAGGLRTLIWMGNGICLLGALVLLFLHDIHGAALLAGMAVGVVMALTDPIYQPE
jgi:rhomboid family protein